MVTIPGDRLARNPLITEAGYRGLTRLLQHPDAPAWNYVVGDRVERADLEAVDAVRTAVRMMRRPGAPGPPSAILDWAERARRRVPLLARRLPGDLDLERDWAAVPTLARGDLAVSLEDIVPPDEDLSRLIVYDTSGVTGHAIKVPHHPRAIAQNHALMEFVLERHGVALSFSPDVVACLNVGAQVSTVVFATVFSVWNQALFAKLNLHPRGWQPAKAQRFFADAAPLFLTGDPLGFAEMIAWGIDTRPAAMVSTAVALLPGLRDRLREAYGCPLIDTYATTETGPIAYSAPDGDGMSVLPTDLYVEVVDDSGRPVPEGAFGEICVTGGRNPFLPLVRYRTGDFGRLRWTGITGADPAPRLIELRARQAVSFRAADGSVVSAVDIGRIIRDWVFVQHAFVQRRDGSCDLSLKPAAGCPIDIEAMRARLSALFGPGVDVRVRLDWDLGAASPGGKVEAWSHE